MTVSQFLAQVPEKWRCAQLAIEDGIGRGCPVVRISLHRDDNGRQVILVHDKRIVCDKNPPDV